MYISNTSNLPGFTPCSYTIDFGDGNTSSGTSLYATHSYNEMGNYEICLTVTFCDNSGNPCCTDTKCQTVNIPCYGLRTSGQSTELSGTNQLTVYPSPASDRINLSLPEGFTGAVYLADMNGKQLQSASDLGQNMWQANVAELAPGLYFVIAENANGEKLQNVFVKE